MNKEFLEKVKKAGERLIELMDIYEPYQYLEIIKEDGKITSYEEKFKENTPQEAIDAYNEALELQKSGLLITR